MEKITITPIVLRNQKPTDIKECYIELHDDHLYYRIEFFADEPIINDDPDSGWEQVFNSYEWIAMKANIAGIEKSFTKDKKWGIYIVVNGFANDLKFYYKTQSLAQQAFDKLHQWLLNGQKA